MLQKSTVEDRFEVYTVCCDMQPKSPGRKFDDLLVNFQPCPHLVVYSGSCQPVSGAAVTGLEPGNYVVVSSNSEFDMSAEVVHASKLCALRKWRDGDVVFDHQVYKP